jgi:hypothetical protein
MKTWGVRGVRTSLEQNGKPMIRNSASGSVLRLGVTIPLVTRFFVGRRIKSRESAISKIGHRLSQMVTAEKGKIEKVIAAAERTDIHSLVDRARSLQDKLEEAACVKVKFRETEEDEEPGRPSKPARVPKKEPANILCIKAIAKELFGKDETTGLVTGRDDAQRFKHKRGGLNPHVEECMKSGRTTIPAVLVDVLTSGAKKTDVEINVS